MPIRAIAMYVTLALASACYKYSGPLHESATVKHLIYTAGQHGQAVGFNTKGAVHVSSIDTNSEYAAMLECQHGTFVTKLAQSTWEHLHEGDSISLTYQEVTDRHGAFVKYKLLSVNP